MGKTMLNPLTPLALAHGGTGQPSAAELYRDAQTAWDHLIRQRGIAPQRIVLFGESLGGAVAAWLAAREQPGALVRVPPANQHELI